MLIPKAYFGRPEDDSGMLQTFYSPSFAFETFQICCSDELIWKKKQFMCHNKSAKSGLHRTHLEIAQKPNLLEFDYQSEKVHVSPHKSPDQI